MPDENGAIWIPNNNFPFKSRRGTLILEPLQTTVTCLFVQLFLLYALCDREHFLHLFSLCIFDNIVFYTLYCTYCTLNANPTFYFYLWGRIPLSLVRVSGKGQSTICKRCYLEVNYPYGKHSFHALVVTPRTVPAVPRQQYITSTL